MAIQHARVCGACERECPSWAQRCPACGSSAISLRMILSPPSDPRGHIRADEVMTRPRRVRAKTPAPGATALSGG